MGRRGKKWEVASRNKKMGQEMGGLAKKWSARLKMGTWAKKWANGSRNRKMSQ